MCDSNKTGPFHTSLRSISEQWSEWQKSPPVFPTNWSDPEKLKPHFTYLLFKRWALGVRAVIVTKAKIDFSKICVQPGAEIISLEDDSCASSAALVEYVQSEHGKFPSSVHPVVVMKCSRYSKLHHAHLRRLLDLPLNADIFIVYYQVRDRVASTFRWPVFFIEDISDFDQFGGESYSYQQIEAWGKLLEDHAQADHGTQHHGADARSGDRLFVRQPRSSNLCRANALVPVHFCWG
jgi:hypothetical protein